VRWLQDEHDFASGRPGNNSPGWFLSLMNSPAVKAETEFARRSNEAI
jgi:hypothetical protein